MKSWVGESKRIAIIGSVSILIFAIIISLYILYGGPLPQKGKFSEENLEIIEVKWREDIDWDEKCKKCLTLNDCLSSPTYKYSITLPSDWSKNEILEITCKKFIDGKLIETYTPGTTGTIEFSLPNLDVDRNHTLKICCEDICKSKILPAKCVKEPVTSFQEAYELFIKKKGDEWEESHPNCPLRDYTFAIVYADLITNTIECRWLDTIGGREYKDVIQEKDPTIRSGYSSMGKQLAELIDSCNMTTLETYRNAIAQEPENFALSLGTVKPIRVSEFYFLHVACYDWDRYFKEKDVTVFTNALIDVNTGLIYT